MANYTSARLEPTTLKALRALRRMTPEHDETIDEVVQKLIRFYLKKPSESNKAAKRKGGVA